MKTSKTISAQDRALLDRINSLIGISDPTPEALASDMTDLGIDPKELQQAVFQRVRGVATQKYSSMGKNMPALMSEVLKQTRPPTAQEEEASRSERATSRVQGFLASLKDAGRMFDQPLAFAPAYRNKQQDAVEDEALLRSHQEALDEEGEL